MVSAVGTLVVSYAMDWSLLRLTIVLMDTGCCWGSVSRLFCGAWAF
ncbi:hypothetical protein [Sulfobacillus thermotolerans]